MSDRHADPTPKPDDARAAQRSTGRQQTVFRSEYRSPPQGHSSSGDRVRGPNQDQGGHGQSGRTGGDAAIGRRPGDRVGSGHGHTADGGVDQRANRHRDGHADGDVQRVDAGVLLPRAPSGGPRPDNPAPPFATSRSRPTEELVRPPRFGPERSSQPPGAGRDLPRPAQPERLPDTAAARRDRANQEALQAVGGLRSGPATFFVPGKPVFPRGLEPR
jgi:hypothetical protein